MGAIDNLPTSDEEEAAPRPVIGAPEPGMKKNYAPIGGGPSALDALPTEEEPDSAMPLSDTEESRRRIHPMLFQAPGDWTPGETPTFASHAIESLPWVGDPLHRGINALASGGDPAARAMMEGAQEVGTAAHPGWATAGDITGEVGGIAAMAAAAPEAFGLTAATKLGGAVLGGGSSVIVKGIDNLIRGRPPTDGLPAAAAGGAIGGAFTAGVNRMFNAAVQPRLEEIAKKAIVDHKIPLPAGMISANPLIARLPGQLLSSGSGARALAAWHRAIVRTTGVDAPVLSAKVLAQADKRLRDAVQKLKPGDTIEQHADLFAQMRATRVLENVIKKHPDGIFSPEEFQEGVQEGVDAIARHRTETFALNGGGDVADLAKIGTTFLKGTPNPKMDLTAVGRMVVQSAKLLGPAVGHHLYAHGLSMPDIMTGGAITAATGVAKLLARSVGAIGARSTKVANALVGQSAPLALVRPVAALARPLAPGLAQQSVPFIERAFQEQPKP